MHSTATALVGLHFICATVSHFRASAHKNPETKWSALIMKVICSTQALLGLGAWIKYWGPDIFVIAVEF